MLAADPNAIALHQQTRIRSESEKVHGRVNFMERDLDRQTHILSNIPGSGRRSDALIALGLKRIKPMSRIPNCTFIRALTLASPAGIGDITTPLLNRAVSRANFGDRSIRSRDFTWSSNGSMRSFVQSVVEATPENSFFSSSSALLVLGMSSL